MINLIPNEEKKKMFKDFYLRLTSVSFAMLGLSFLLASLAIAPAYVAAISGEKSVEKRIETQKEDPVSVKDQDTLDATQELNKKLSTIEKISLNKYYFSQRIINEIILKKGSRIKVTQISYRKTPLGEKIVDVSGIASSRDALLSFRKTLEDNPAFSSVDLPISNFVKGSNIRFQLTLIPAPENKK